MKRNTKTKAIIAALVLFTLMPMTVAPSHAMTPLPPSLLDGSPSYGASLPEECGIVIENQTITYDIPEFPAYDNTEVIKGYKGSVRTDYTLYNPTDSEISLKVAFPLSILPKYQSEALEADNPAKSSILINGEEIEAELRHCTDYNYYNMTPDDFASKVTDEYLSNDFCSPDMTVTKYLFKQSGVERAGAYVGFDVGRSEFSGSCIYFGEYANAWDQTDGDRRFNTLARENGFIYELYVFGNDLMHLPEWKFYKDLSLEDDEEIEGKMEFVSKETTTLREFVSGYYDESLGISEVDWFNMAATEFSVAIENGQPYTSLSGLRTGFSDYLIRGFICEISIKPNERVITTFNAPVYPSVETLYDPPKFIYNYLLSKNSAGLHTGQININVNTPYYMLVGEGFEKTENGYKKTMNAIEVVSDKISVEQESFLFTLCEVENPERKERGRSTGWLVLLILFVLLPIGLIIEAVKSVIKVVKNGFQSIRSKIIK